MSNLQKIVVGSLMGIGLVVAALQLECGSSGTPKPDMAGPQGDMSNSE